MRQNDTQSDIALKAVLNLDTAKFTGSFDRPKGTYLNVFDPETER